MAKLITFEGIDGGGKTSCIDALGQHLTNMGYNVRYAKERDVENDELTQALAPFMMKEKRKELSPIEILFVILTIRSHYHKIVLGDLIKEKDTIILMDRYYDSTFAYNYSKEFQETCDFMRISPKTLFNMLHHFATHGDYIIPDRTYLLDVDIDSAYIYSYQRDGYALYNKEELIGFRDRYMMMAKSNPERIKVIDSNNPLHQVIDTVKVDLDGWLQEKRIMP